MTNIQATYNEQLLLGLLPKEYKYIVKSNRSVFCYATKPKMSNRGSWINTHPYSLDSYEMNIYMFYKVFTSLEENVVYSIIDIIGDKADNEREEEDGEE